MSQIPTEIIEHIIDELSDDREALVASLSVSRAFHTRARFYLFQTVRIETESEFHQFISLCDISPVIPTLVQSLKMLALVSVSQLPSLPNITSLHVRGLLDDVWKTNFLSITSLTLEDILFPSTRSFRMWICAYPHLTSLSLISVIVHRPVVFGAYALAQGPPLEFLSIASVSYSVYWAFIGIMPITEVGSFALHGLHKIQYKAFTPDDVRGLRKILAVTCGTLRGLDIYMNLSEPMEASFRPDFSQVPTVEYHPSCISKSSLMSSLFTLSLCVLPGSSRSTSMERLFVHLDLTLISDFLENADLHDCLKLLDSKLADSRYCNLKVVQFNVTVHQAIRDVILTAMPKLHAAGQMVVEEEII
ncbi:uncharacterized protein EV420DRAFT_1551438 [Desarmillaria tabescens]|uniref:F-box domain-containing protein n=1 Tax=Armillaria tabescens TaxID=1929756 RepID=A0AA39K9J9_ARMTA|nr:uncharacterized protein EV420DRAFT_1551438 [Desarmillaria tabescens]KAK0457101.1 hypothetical protein EV420DRAFT_1551438 [Desarmillaria tabescens]